MASAVNNPIRLSGNLNITLLIENFGSRYVLPIELFAEQNQHTQ